MKLIGLVGNDEAKKEALRRALVENLRFRSFSALGASAEYLRSQRGQIDTPGDLRLLVGMLAKKTGLVETLLVSNVFDHAADNASGLIVTDILEQKTVDLIRNLGGSIVFVGNTDYTKQWAQVDTSDNETLKLNIERFTADELQKVLNTGNVLHDFCAKPMKEALKIQQTILQRLTVAGFKLFDTEIYAPRG